MSPKSQREVGLRNLEEVALLLARCPGITNREIGERLGLSVMAVGRHVKVLRQRWMEGTSSVDPHVARAEPIGACEGCGSTRSMDELKKLGAISCCPERKILTASQWRDRAIRADDEIERINAAIRRAAWNLENIANGESASERSVRLREASPRDLANGELEEAAKLCRDIIKRRQGLVRAFYSDRLGAIEVEQDRRRSRTP